MSSSVGRDDATVGSIRTLSFVLQWTDNSLTFIQVPLFQLLEQLRPLLPGTGSAHHPMATLCRLLVGWRRLSAVGV
jgi:hypothetical protein